jgi:hypothetical protein
MNRFEMRIHSAANVSGANRWLWKHVAICAALIAALLAFTPATWAQENATVTGTVSDSSGAVVPNATVNLTNPATGQTRSVTSNDVGAYRFANVGIGTYNLVVTATGFAKFERTGIVVNVAQTVEANATLNVGAQAATVTVAAQALQVQTETSEVSTLISGQQVARLSTNGRNIVQLAALGMGVANTLASFGGVNALTSSSGISFNGTRNTHNIYLLDGGELNDRGCGGCYMVLPSQDAIAEFKTLDSNYSPDYGIGSGGTITMVIKSGTRQFHGSLYEFNRNTAYNANDYFNKQAKRPRPKFQLNEPGGNIGGPLFIPHVYNESKTRTFFFVNEEWRRLIQGSAPSVSNTVMASNFPTAGQSLNYTPYTSNPIIPVVPNLPNNASYTQKETNLGLTPGQPFPKNSSGQYVIPAQLLDANAIMEVNAGTFPKPNSPNGYQYIVSIPQPTNVREDAVRIDHAINSKFQLMGHYVHDAVEPTFFPPLWTGSYATVGTTMKNPSYSAVIKLTQTYSPNLLNETAFNYSGNKIFLAVTDAPGVSSKIPSGWTASTFFPVSQQATNDMPAISLSGKPFGANYNEGYFPWKNGYEGFNYRDDVSWIKGRHQFKFGFGWLHDYKNQQLQANTQGTANFSSSNANFSGDAYVDFMLGLANSFTQLNYLAGKHWVNNNYGFYANDNWHVNSRLVLNLGFRFDGMPHAFERYNRFANFVPADYNYSLGYPFNSDNSTLNPAYLTTFEGAQFYLNGIRQAGVNGFPRGNVKNDYLTWQPRIGFAYDLFGNGKTVLRGGFGTFYERVQGNDVYNAALNPPFAYQPSANNVLFSNPNTSALTGQTTSQHFPSTMTTIKFHYPNPATAMYSLGFQHEVGPSIVAQLQYVGTDGWNQNNDRQINTLPLVDSANPANPYDLRQQVAGGKSPNPWRIFPGFSSINQQENTTHFNYNSLQAGLRVENRHGATATFAYTWSHLIDIQQNDLNGVTAPFNLKYDRGSDAGYDHRHMFNASYVYDFPFFPKGSNRAAREILGGWSVSGVTMAQVGTPIVTALTGVDTVGLGNGGNRPNLVSKVKYPKTQSHWFDKSAFATPLPPWPTANGSGPGYGTAGKDSVVGPGLFNWNLSLFKIIPLTPGEGTNLELRFESFNTFNHTNFTSVDLNSGDGNFGAVTADYAPRVLELGGKITF